MYTTASWTALVSTAARYATDQVKEEYGDDTSVADDRFIGDSSLCLRI